jgi:hypothetical protein
MRAPTTWSETPPTFQRLAPRLGEHSEEVLLEAGFSPAEVASLVESGVTLLDPDHAPSHQLAARSASAARAAAQATRSADFRLLAR